MKHIPVTNVIFPPNSFSKHLIF